MTGAQEVEFTVEEMEASFLERYAWRPARPRPARGSGGPGAAPARPRPPGAVRRVRRRWVERKPRTVSNSSDWVLWRGTRW